MRFSLIASLFMATVTLAAADFTHDVTSEKKPWTHERFQDDPDEFSFIILPDRNGSERPGIFPEAIRKANLFHPEFIITVGDLIEGQMLRQHQDHDHLRKQWQELNSFTAKSEAPFFHIVGNHDIARTREGFPRSNETSREVWAENCGDQTYYSFVYKNVLFLCLNTMEGKDSRPHPVGITAEQAQWAKKVLAENPDVRWTLVFLHQPDECVGSGFLEIEKELVKRNYTVFAGDWHCYVKFQRHNRNYYVLATAGGISKMRGEKYGEFDHLTYVTMTKKGPKVVNVKLDGILDEDVVDAYNIQRPIRRNLDLPRKNIHPASIPAPASVNGKWQVSVSQEMMNKHIKRNDASVQNGIVRITGNNSRRRWEAIPLPMPPAGVKKIKLTANIRTNITKGSFCVMIRRIDANGNSLDYDGPIVKTTQDWKNMSEIIEITPNTDKIQLVIQSMDHLDSNSFGEVRNIVIEEVGSQKAKSAASTATANRKWKFAVTPEIMNKYLKRGTASIKDGTIRIIGNNSRRRWEVIPLNMPNPGGKKIKLTADIRTNITKGNFSVMVRRVKADGSTIDYDGPFLKSSQDWKTMTEIIDIQPSTAKLELYIQTNDNMDENSYGEVRNIIIEEIK